MLPFQLSPQDFKKALETDDVLLIDVRTPEERETYGVIQEDQVHINIHEVGAGEKLLQLPKEKHLLLYCWHGNRSNLAVQFLKKNGYKQVHDLGGGIDAWSFS